MIGSVGAFVAGAGDGRPIGFGPAAAANTRPATRRRGTRRGRASAVGRRSARRSPRRRRAPPIASPKPIHSAMPVPAARSPPRSSARCARIGATMNAATARNSSMIANTRCRLADCSEKPATNSAGATVAPSASPVSAEPTRASGWFAGSAIAEHQDSSREQRHADQRQVVHRALRVMTKPNTTAMTMAPPTSGR